MRKTVPYLFLGLLCIVLFFVIGVRYGQSVQKANQTVPTPTGAPSATPAPTDKPSGSTRFPMKDPIEFPVSLKPRDRPTATNAPCSGKKAESPYRLTAIRSAAPWKRQLTEQS
jgi:hypothetical protein